MTQAPAPGRRPARAGFTLVEITVAMTLTLAVFAITLPFVRAQTRALGASAGRLDADQIARYAQRAIDRDLRLASAETGQPMIVYAGPMGISFNANLLAADTLDPGAAELETGAATTLTDAWRLANAGAIPKGLRSYPAQDYLDGSGTISRFETISYFLHPDTVSGRSDLYVLYRKVNNRDSVQIVRSIQVAADSAFFSYYRTLNDSLQRIANTRLPLWWDSTAIDSIRSVGLRSTGYYRDRLTGTETLRTVFWVTAIPNAAGRLGAAGCGAAPGTPVNVTVTEETATVPYRARVVWTRSADDGTGASDVRHYVIDRQLTGGIDPYVTLATVPATGAASYRWEHALPGNGPWTYGVRAVDCGSAISARDTDNGTFP